MSARAEIDPSRWGPEPGLRDLNILPAVPPAVTILALTRKYRTSHCSTPGSLP